MELKIGCVLMASGNAKRFGDNKLNKKLNGISLIDRALNAIPVDKLYKVAVVSQYSEVIDKAHRYGFTGIKNKHPDYGISHTIKLGLDATNDCDAVMFMVSDQPLLRKDSVSQMLDFYIKNSNSNTTAQQETATISKSAPTHAATIPTMRATSPEMGLWVAFTIAGNVITARVTYGT